jgi:pentapeptide MXKDX repeat protein
LTIGIPIAFRDSVLIQVFPRYSFDAAIRPHLMAAFFLPRVTYSEPAHPMCEPGGIGLGIAHTTIAKTITGDLSMKRKFVKLMSAVMLFGTMLFGSMAFAQSGDAMKQDNMKNDQMKSDDSMKKDDGMKKDDMAKDSKKKKSKKAKKDAMAKDDNMKKDDMKKDDGMKH